MVEGNTGWAIEVVGYEDIAPLFSSLENRDASEDIDPLFNVFGVLKIWSMPYSWGYLDAGLGLGLGKGEWTENCEKSASSGGGFIAFNSTYECNVYEGLRVGVPLQASAVFGKYIGLGMSLNVFIQKDNVHSQVLFSFPLGKFTK